MSQNVLFIADSKKYEQLMRSNQMTDLFKIIEQDGCVIYDMNSTISLKITPKLVQTCFRRTGRTISFAKAEWYMRTYAPRWMHYYQQRLAEDIHMLAMQAPVVDKPLPLWRLILYHLFTKK